MHRDFLVKYDVHEDFLYLNGKAFEFSQYNVGKFGQILQGVREKVYPTLMANYQVSQQYF